jgi:hypothetical protein
MLRNIETHLKELKGRFHSRDEKTYKLSLKDIENMIFEEYELIKNEDITYEAFRNKVFDMLTNRDNSDLSGLDILVK